MAPCRISQRRQKRPKSKTMYLLDNFSTRVIVLIDSVTEPEEDSFSFLDFLDNFRNVIFRSDFFKHPDDSLIGSSMSGSIESTSGHSDGCIDIDSRAGYMPDEGGRAVHFVFCVENEKNIKSFDEFRVRFELLLIESIQHVEEILNIAQFLTR